VGEKQKPEARLAYFFHRNGYLRLPDQARRRQEGSRKYKKGYEVRLVARSEVELKQMTSLLRQVGLKAGRPYQKGKQKVQPIYGKQAVERFGQLLSQAGAPKQPS
jgi:hypothetical protein